jgi:AraC-like DNA-binding protein
MPRALHPGTRIIPLHLHPLGFIEAFTQLGAPLDRLLRGTGITPAMLADTGARISYLQQSLLLRNGIRLCRRPGLGLIVGSEIDWCYQGTVGGVVHCSPSLAAAAEAFRRYAAIAQPYYVMYMARPHYYVDENGGLVTVLDHLAAVEDEDPELFQFEMEHRLAVTLRVVDLCGNKSAGDPAVHVALHYPEPPHGQMYRDLPCASVTFGAAASHLTTSVGFAVTPFRPLREAQYKRLMAQCEAELEAARLEVSYSDKVRWHLSVAGRQPPPLTRIARYLGLTARALARRLATEGVSYRVLAHETRMEAVMTHLRHSQLGIDEISELFGFSSASSLRRAIKNWCGRPAGAVRRDGDDTSTPGTRGSDEACWVPPLNAGET